MTQLESDLQELRAADLPLKAKRKLLAVIKGKHGPLVESDIAAWRESVRAVQPLRVVSRADSYAESEAKWDRIFNEKFLDPTYYTDPLLPWSRSCLTGF